MGLMSPCGTCGDMKKCGAFLPWYSVVSSIVVWSAVVKSLVVWTWYWCSSVLHTVCIAHEDLQQWSGGGVGTVCSSLVQLHWCGLLHCNVVQGRAIICGGAQYVYKCTR